MIKAAFFSIFRDLQDHAPEIFKILQNFVKIWSFAIFFKFFYFSKISLIFCKTVKISTKICIIFENQVHDTVDLEKC